MNCNLIGNGTHQSPINIELNESVHDYSLNEIEFRITNLNLNNKCTEIWEAKNNGHTVEIKCLNKQLYINLKNEVFNLNQMHFHWHGSEHHVNGQKFAAELHLVHQSINNTNNFAVIAYLFRVSDI